MCIYTLLNNNMTNDGTPKKMSLLCDKYLFSRSERSERRVNNCLSRLRGTALSVMAVEASLT